MEPRPLPPLSLLAPQSTPALPPLPLRGILALYIRHERKPCLAVKDMKGKCSKECPCSALCCYISASALSMDIAASNHGKNKSADLDDSHAEEPMGPRFSGCM